MTKKKILKAGAFLLALALIGGCVALTDFFTGWPVSRLRVSRTAKAYLQETYPGTDYAAQTPDSLFRLGQFRVDVLSPSSPDSAFSLYFSRDGALVDDTYESDVTARWGTARRLSDAYNRRVQEICAAAFPDADGASGDLMDAAVKAIDPNADITDVLLPWDTTALELDRDYDLPPLSARYGDVSVQLAVPEPSAEAAADILITLKAAMEEAGLPFRCATLLLPETARAEEGILPDTFCLEDFPWEDITPDGLPARVQAALDARSAAN